MKVLVTGAGGFIGSHLTKYLLDSSLEVIALDNYNDYYSPIYKKHRFEELVGKHSCLTSRVLDICDSNAVTKLFNDESPDVVVHLAGQAGVRLQSSQNYKYIDSNIIGFGNVMNSAIQSGVHAFLYASSSSVYGNSSKFPLEEQDSNLRPVSFYGATKLANESMAQILSPHTKMRILGMRFFSVYGPWGRPDMAYFKIANSLYSNKIFKIFGDGTQVRDLTHVIDVVKSIYLLLLQLDAGTKSFPPIVNIGGGRPRSLNDLISALEHFSSKKLVSSYESESNLDVKKTEASFDRLQNLINFVPSIDIQEGAQSIISWIENPQVLQELDNWAIE